MKSVETAGRGMVANAGIRVHRSKDYDIGSLESLKTHGMWLTCNYTRSF